MTIETQTDKSLPPGKFKVWYDREWTFASRAEAEAFAADLHARKVDERRAYGFSPPIVWLVLPEAR